MISPERIAELARQRAQQTFASQEAERAENEKRRARDQVEHLAHAAAFEQILPHLQEQARQVHQTRFQPLQAMLDTFVEPMKKIRDSYFPGSPVFVADHYEAYIYSDEPERYRDNTYYRALMVLDRNVQPGTDQRLLGVYAIAKEPAGRRFGKFGPYKDTQYSVGIGNHHIYAKNIHPEGAQIWGKLIESATGVTEDLTYITREEDLFEVQQANGGGRILFGNYAAASPSLKDIKGALSEPIRYRQDPKMFTAIEERFAAVLYPRELRALQATGRGSPPV